MDPIQRLLATGFVPWVKDDVVVLTSPSGQSVITVPLELFGSQLYLFCSGTPRVSAVVHGFFILHRSPDPTPLSGHFFR
jgi:hypothetical protein